MKKHASRARFAVSLFALACLGFGGDQNFSATVIPKTTVDSTFRALRDGRQSQIQLRKLQIKVNRDGRDIRELILFRDQDSGNFLAMVKYVGNGWGFDNDDRGRSDILPNTAISIDKGTMRAFFFLGFAMLVSESSTRSANLEAAQKQVLAKFVEDAPAALGNTWWASDERWIRLRHNLPKEVMEHTSGASYPPANLGAFEPTGRCWTMKIHGPNASFYRITIDDGYDITTLENCAKPRQPGRNVVMPATEVKFSILAIRNNQATRLEMRCAVAAVVFPNGQSGRIQLRMVYDQVSKLFWWTAITVGERTSEEQIQRDNQMYPDSMSKSLFVTDDRIVFFADSVVLESSERYPDWNSAKAHVVSDLEKMRGNLQMGHRTKPFHILRTGIPREFFYVPMSSFMPPPKLTQAEKLGRLWKLKFTGHNRNSAEVILNEKYQRLSVRLFENPNNIEFSSSHLPARPKRKSAK